MVLKWELLFFILAQDLLQISLVASCLLEKVISRVAIDRTEVCVYLKLLNWNPPYYVCFIEVWEWTFLIKRLVMLRGSTLVSVGIDDDFRLLNIDLGFLFKCMWIACSYLWIKKTSETLFFLILLMCLFNVALYLVLGWLDECFDCFPLVP